MNISLDYECMCMHMYVRMVLASTAVGCHACLNRLTAADCSVIACQTFYTHYPLGNCLSNV